MDENKFASLISFITSLIVKSGIEYLDSTDIKEINRLVVDLIPEKVDTQERAIVSAVDVETLIKCMQEKTNKIETIKALRQITDLGLKDAKDLVDRYW